MSSRSAPCFPGSVTLLHPHLGQLSENVCVIRAAFENMYRMSAIADVEQLLQNVTLPHTIRYNVLAFHWDARTETGYYVPFDVLPIIEFLASVRSLIEESRSTGFFRELQSVIEEKYVNCICTFGGPVAFSFRYDPPAHMCVSGRITPDRVAVKNLHRRSDMQMGNDHLFAEFKSAIETRLYHHLQWYGVYYKINNFLGYACAVPRSEPAQISDVAEDDKYEPQRLAPAGSSAGSSASSVTSEGSSTMQPAGAPEMAPELYVAMQSGQVAALQAQGHGTAFPTSFTVCFPDLVESDRKVQGARIKSLHSLESYLRGAFCKDRFWAEVVVEDSKGARVNHVTFETAVRETGAAFVVHMHRFLDLAFSTRVSVLDQGGSEQGAVDVVLTHRSYRGLVSRVRSVGAERLGVPGILNPTVYLAEINDTATDGEGVHVNAQSYGEYVRGVGAVMTVVFYPPREQAVAGGKHGAEEPVDASGRALRRRA